MYGQNFLELKQNLFPQKLKFINKLDRFNSTDSETIFIEENHLRKEN